MDYAPVTVLVRVGSGYLRPEADDVTVVRRCIVCQVDIWQRRVARTITRLPLSIWCVGEQVVCTFPRQWRGRYFQSGLGDVFIRDRAITTKGHCVEHNRDYFLFHNRSVT